ncbi:hypothetical protein O9G_004022 [Rozella allomycis CSF55]|uniref:Uncharacterized protein n=1 Tax=Rozella allomycis (strain CSF55) TaxID=988480 RepID=A0A075AWK8_ROZAC|nr:hypothetical protein O9G_004022 [Rozella allomycis CSF55]|eukprot:EPZ34715.1 hypothetical protein O9G_004022 [Rozella allomycis CSF55]
MKVSKVADVNYWPGDIKQNSYKVYLIQRWNKRFFKTRRIEMHEESITCLLYQHPYVITASAERTIKILDLCNDKQVATLEGHKDTISAMAVQKDILVSASFDKSIRIWSLSERKEKQCLSGHKSSVNTVQYRKSLIASGSSDKTVRLWRYNMDGTFAHHRTLNGHESGIKCLDFDDYILLSMSFDQQLRMWHLATGNCVRMYVTITTMDGNVLLWTLEPTPVTKEDNESVVEYIKWASGDVMTLKVPIEMHKSWVLSCKIDDWRIITCSADKTLKVYNYFNGCNVLEFKEENVITSFDSTDNIIVYVALKIVMSPSVEPTASTVSREWNEREVTGDILWPRKPSWYLLFDRMWPSELKILTSWFSDDEAINGYASWKSSEEIRDKFRDLILAVEETSQ